MKAPWGVRHSIQGFEGAIYTHGTTIDACETKKRVPNLPEEYVDR